MLREIIDAVLAPDPGASAPDIEVVAHAATERELRRLVGGRCADVVIVGLEGDDMLSEGGRELFAENPYVTLLGLSAEGRYGFLYQLRPHRIPLGAVSPESLVSAIHEAARRREDPWREILTANRRDRT